MSRPRPRTLAIGALALLLAAAPFVPRGGDDEGRIAPSGDRTGRALATADTAPRGRVTPELQAEIDRVLAAGRAQAHGRVPVKAGPSRLASALVRCADFDGQRYCLHTGWTDSTQAQVQARVAAAARTIAARPAATETTGDLDELATLRRFGRMSPSARADAERAELTDAARSVAKVWLLRHAIDGVKIPSSVLAAHPEMLATSGTAAARTRTTQPKRKTRGDYPQKAHVLNGHDVSEQHQTYWCGPTTMQMVAWGWTGHARSQQHWANKLGTTSSGTAITDMVRVTNAATGWDDKDHAGAYITLDVGDYGFGKWQLLLFRHIVDYKAPVILHPILLKKYYPYLDDDASGHFQVGRGYKKRGDKPNQIGYFEPWDQQRFDPSEPYIDRVQWRQAYKSYRANEAHFQHNIGV